MATYYVATTGSDSNTCLQAQNPLTPKLTIAAGISCLSSGDTLIIKTGTYVENNLGLNSPTIPSGGGEGTRTTVKADTGNVVTIRPSSGTGCLFVYSKSYIDIRDIIFDGINQSGNGIYCGRQSGNPVTSHHIRFINCEVKNTGFSGIAFGFNQDDAINCSMHAINCIVHDTGRVDNTHLSHGIYNTGQNNIIDGCLCYNNPGHGIHCYAHDRTNGSNNSIMRNNICRDNGTQGVGTYDGSNMLVYNNICYNNGNNGVRVGSRSVNVGVYNNTCYNNGSYGVRIESGRINTQVKNNIVYLNSSGTISDLGVGTQRSNNLENINPLFVNASGGNFQLLSNSPAIDAGITISGFNTDHAGVSRPQGVRWDIGAYEFSGGAPTDNTPPVVALTSPNNGTTVSGTIAITANASDNVAVSNVTFFLDGNQLGSADLNAPYTIQWNTLGSSNGSHTVFARAIDPSGNTTNSSSVTVTVNNILDPPPPGEDPPDPPPPTEEPPPPTPTGEEPILADPIPFGALFFNTLEEFSKPKVEGVFPSVAEDNLEIDPDDWINVTRDLGVKGDGTDETHLIQRAFDLARDNPKKKVLIPSHAHVTVSVQDIDNNFGGIYGHGQLLVALWIDSNTYLRNDGSLILSKPINQDYADFGAVILQNRNSFRAVAGKASLPTPDASFDGGYQGLINSQAHTNGSSSTTIQLTNNPDLSSVVAENWEPIPDNLYLPVYPLRLWLNVGGGTFTDIVSVSNTNKTITVANSFNIASGTPVDYSIENNLRDLRIGIDGKGFFNCNVGTSSLEWSKALGFRFYRCEDLNIKEVNVVNTRAEGAQIGFSQRITLNNVSFFNSKLVTACLNLDVCSNVVLDNCKFYSNNASVGVYSWASRYVNINKCLFKDIYNFSTNVGAGIQFSGRGQEFKEFILGWPADES